MSKTPAIEETLNRYTENVFGRKRIKGKCVTCGKPVKDEDFRDALSRKEYTISFMCQKCQDMVFDDSFFEEGERGQ